MLEYSFDKFQETYKNIENGLAKKKPFLHYYADEKKILLTFRNDEGNDVYTIVPTSKIEEFGQHYEVDSETAMNHFYENYLSNAIRLLSDPRGIDSMPLNEIPSSNQEDLRSGDGTQVIEETNLSSDPLDDAYFVNDDTPPLPFKRSYNSQEIVESRYTDFLKSLWSFWESNSLKALKELDKSYTKKSYADFLKRLFNVDNTKLLGKISLFVRQGMKAGISSAENDSGKDIGFTLSMENRVKSLEYEQLNGYSMANGERWHGLKGASSELQQKVLDVVSEGVKNKKTAKELANDVQEVFDVSKSRAENIATTETTRFYNEAKQLSFEEIGMRYKRPVAVMDKNTSELCKRLHKKYSGQGVIVSEKYIDDVSGASFLHPPHHPRCFLEGTKIQTIKGYKPIEEISIGDSVLTHKYRYRRVTGTMQNESQDYYELVIGSQQRTRKLRVTGNHPILTTRGWVEVRDLKMTDKVLFYGEDKN